VVTEPHRARAIAESFGTDAERYDQTRPAYPDAMVQRIVAASPGPDVLDVGCGTGTAARQFRTAGCTVLGVEPDARMAEFARRRGIEVEVATIEAWDPAGRTFDAVVAGTAWHWVDPVAGAAKAGQVLRPGGRLALFWHVFELPPAVADAFADVYHRVVPDSPFAFRSQSRGMDLYQPIRTKAADGIRAAGDSTDPEQWRFDWERTYTRAEWLDQLPTTGPMTRLAPDQLAEVLDGVGAAIDGLGGTFTMAVRDGGRHRPTPLTRPVGEAGRNPPPDARGRHRGKGNHRGWHRGRGATGAGTVGRKPPPNRRPPERGVRGARPRGRHTERPLVRAFRGQGALRRGGGGNRTRVLRRFDRASPGAARDVSTRPHRSSEQAGVTGPVAVRCPSVTRDRSPR
jgi:SAM-dependent methyltransferase